MRAFDFRRCRCASRSNPEHLDARAFPLVRRWMFAIYAMLLFCSLTWAQVESGQIAGTVTDQSGAAVPRATVMVRNLASNGQRSAQSSDTGAYVLVGLEPGTYSVTVRAADFKEFNTNVEVTVGGHVT